MSTTAQLNMTGGKQRQQQKNHAECPSFKSVAPILNSYKIFSNLLIFYFPIQHSHIASSIKPMKHPFFPHSQMVTLLLFFQLNSKINLKKIVSSSLHHTQSIYVCQHLCALSQCKLSLLLARTLLYLCIILYLFSSIQEYYSRNALLSHVHQFFMIFPISLKVDNFSL